MNKKKLFKIIGFIILALIIIFLVHVIQNFIIISKIQNNVSKYQNTKNVHYTTNINKLDSEEFVEVYIKDNESKSILEHKDKTGKQNKMIQVITVDERRNYFETNDSKTVKIYKEDNNAVGFEPYFYNYMTFGDKIKDSITLFINSEKIDGKDYYVLNGLTSSLLYEQNAIDGKMYINKETGIREKMIEKVIINDEIKEITCSYEYIFDVVTENDLIPPDLSEYEIQDN